MFFIALFISFLFMPSLQLTAAADNNFQNAYSSKDDMLIQMCLKEKISIDFTIDTLIKQTKDTACIHDRLAYILDEDFDRAQEIKQKHKDDFLGWTIINGRSIESIRLLLQKGANPYARIDDGQDGLPSTIVFKVLDNALERQLFSGDVTYEIEQLTACLQESVHECKREKRHMRDHIGLIFQYQGNGLFKSNECRWREVMHLLGFKKEVRKLVTILLNRDMRISVPARIKLHKLSLFSQSALACEVCYVLACAIHNVTQQSSVFDLMQLIRTGEAPSYALVSNESAPDALKEHIDTCRKHARLLLKNLNPTAQLTLLSIYPALRDIFTS